MRSDAYREFSDVVGLVWPDWEIVEKLGSGAFASVFRASRKEKLVGEKDSAIKIIRIPQDDSDWDQLLAEGKSVHQVRAYFQEAVDDALKEIRAMEQLGGHTNIVNIYDYKLYEEPGRNVWYILIRMEYLQKINQDHFDEAEIRKLGIDVCTALSICRKKNIVHRDISLDNVFIHDGNYKLGDFGVAKVLEGTVGGIHSIAGKPLYMAPEIFNSTLSDTADIDTVAKVDIYSLGILMYRLSNNMKYPFEDPGKEVISASEQQEAFRRRVIDGETPPPPACVSPGLAGIIQKACSANPARRFSNAEEMKDALLTMESAPEPPGSIWKKVLPVIAALAVLSCAYVFLLQPLLFPGWSEWSDWTETRIQTDDPDQVQEESRKQYKWWAVQCAECSTNNPPDMGMDFKCVNCGKELSGDDRIIYYYSDNLPGFDTYYNRENGHEFNGQIYWFKEAAMRYRYRSKVREDILIEKEKAYRITISPPADMSEEEWTEAQAVLRGRINILSGDRPYGWTLQDGKIRLELPSSAVDDSGLKYVLDYYLTRPVHLYAANDTHDHGVAIPREAMKNVELQYGSIDGINPEDYGIKADKYQYMKITLSESFAKKYWNVFSSWNSLRIAQDFKEYSQWMYFKVSLGNDGKTLYLIDNDESYWPLVLFNYTNDPLPKGLAYSVDINSIADWQDPEQLERKGENQVLPDDMKDPSVTFRLGHYEFSEGQKLDVETALRKRLDSLGVPYALGEMTDNDNESYYMIKTGIGRMGLPVINLLVSDLDYLIIGTRLMPADCLLGSDDYSFQKQGNGFELYIEDDSKAEKVEALAAAALNDDGYIYFYTNYSGFPLFAARADVYLEEKVLRFSDLCEIRDFEYTVRPLESDMLWLRDLLEAVLRTSSIPSLYRPDYQMNESADGTMPSSDHFAVVFDLENKMLKQKIKEICPSATLVKGMLDNSMIIHLNLRLNDQFPAEAVEMVKKIYEAISFPSLYSEYLTVYLAEITIDGNKQNEKAYIQFSKKKDSQSGTHYIDVSGVFANGRMDQYKHELMTRIKESDFFAEFVQDEGSWKTEY